MHRRAVADARSADRRADATTTTMTRSSAADLVIPDDPTVLSYLLSGIVRSSCRAARRCSRPTTTVSRLEGLIRILDREILLLGERLRLFTPDARGSLGGARRS